jgi:hypothetical protein
VCRMALDVLGCPDMSSSLSKVQENSSCAQFLNLGTSVVVEVHLVVLEPSNKHHLVDGTTGTGTD